MPVNLVPIIVDDLWSSLRSRSGFDHVIDSLDDETVLAIKSSWSNAIIDILAKDTPLEPFKP